MPIYEYKCPNGHLFEVFHGMTEQGPTACEVCGEGPLQVVLHPVAVHYKGSGFYSTDYGRGGKSKQPAKDGGSSEGSSSGSDSSSGGSSSDGKSGGTSDGGSGSSSGSSSGSGSSGSGSGESKKSSDS